MAGDRMVYRGRIDDRYVELGRERPKPTQHDLEDGARLRSSPEKPVAFARNPGDRLHPRGLGQMTRLSRSPSVHVVHVVHIVHLVHGRERAAVTFSTDIAPIIFDACVSCHRAGGPGPFPLTTYDEVRRRATQIAQVTRSRFMPPWKVEPGVGHFVGQRPLDDREIALDRAVGEERHARRRSREQLPAAAEARRWLAARQARPDRQA